MAYRMFGAKPIPEPMLVYSQLASWEQISVKLKLESFITFIQKNAFENVVCQNGRHFVQGEVSYLIEVEWRIYALVIEQWSVQIMVRRPAAVKPLSGQMLEYCYFEP